MSYFCVRVAALGAGSCRNVSCTGSAYGLLDSSKIKLVQKTDYPWDGAVSIEVSESKKEAFDIMLRIPEWANGSTVSVNGKKENATAGTYFTINRKWKKAVINIFSVADSEKEKFELENLIQFSINDARIDAEIHVLIKNNEDIVGTLIKTSKNADIVFLWIGTKF